MEKCPCCKKERELDEESGICEECFEALCDDELYDDDEDEEDEEE